ncbi:MAG: NAD(P)H-dependent oxidoreductase [Chitinophagaceae bacterium]
MDTVHFAGISGSLRKGSYNTALLHNIADGLLPANTTIEIFPLHDIPLYNADMDKPEAQSRPVAVQLLRKAFEKADAIVIVSPEYNYSIPGLLKNAIDWASRGEDSPLLHKPVAVMGATPGMWGTVRMQLAFHPVFQYLGMKPLYKPEVLIAQAKTKFDTGGTLTDATARKLVGQQLQALRDLALQEKVMRDTHL